MFGLIFSPLLRSTNLGFQLQEEGKIFLIEFLYPSCNEVWREGRIDGELTEGESKTFFALIVQKIHVTEIQPTLFSDRL